MLDSLRDVLGSGGAVALPAALAAGFITGLNPCCLPMYPAAAATCCAVREEPKRRSVTSAIAFMLGLAVATTIMGVAAAAAGRRLSAVGGWLPYVVALIPIIAGMHFLGMIRIPSPRLPAVQARAGTAFLGGLLVSLVIAPCGTPLLASLLSYAAYDGSLLYGGLLLFVYGVGAGLPVLVLGLAAARLAARLDRCGVRLWVDRVTGALLLAMGLYLLWRA